MAKQQDSQETEVPVRDNAMEERIRVNLCRFIEESGMSQVAIADLAGITQASLSRYTRGENAIPADALKPLADAVGRLVDDFFQRDPSQPSPDRVRNFFLRTRPGVEPTEQDLQEFDEYVARAEKRRAAKLQKQPRR